VALHVDAIVPVLERLFGFHFLDAQVYYITTIPSEVHPHDVLWIAAAAFTLTLLSTIHPALRAARTPPADALRYE
jgi:lipoprotein-releasing system permease protein